jgi:hypothetical protein
MDPITLFALANGAVSAVKAGCKLYKDIKGAAGDVKGVLKDLDDQFHKAYEGKGKTPPPEAKKQLIQEKNRVIELNKRDGETTNIYQEIGNHLGVYYDNYYKCQAVFEEEERRSHTVVYEGEDSIGKRALQRVLMKKQLEAMSTELREIMVYQCPAELGALYTEVEAMMKVMGKEQKALIALQMQRQAVTDKRRKDKMKKLQQEAILGIVILVAVLIIMFMFMLIIDFRIQKFPDLGNCPMPKGTWLYQKWTNTIFATCK